MNYQDVKRRNDEIKNLNRKNEEEAAKRKLLRDIEKHIRTVMIGALADMEAEFGVYWEHGKDKVELEDEQLEERERWEKVRNSILNRGNNKIRAINDEVNNKYVISNKVFEYTFTFKE